MKIQTITWNNRKVIENILISIEMMIKYFLKILIQPIKPGKVSIKSKKQDLYQNECF